MFNFFDELPGIEGHIGRAAAYVEFAEALADNPFKWAALPRSFETKTQVKSAAANIGYGSYKSFPRGQFESAMRGMQVFVRYVGE
jgi:hypothetical protein